MECANPNCFCSGEVGIVKGEDEFCSERCAAAVTRADDDGCDCGHAGCATREEVAPAGAL